MIHEFLKNLNYLKYLKILKIHCYQLYHLNLMYHLFQRLLILH